MILTLAAFVQLAASCGPSVHVDTLAAIARTESRFNTAIIHDNTDGRNYYPETTEEAIRVATELVNSKRHSVDLGVMQINSANLPGLGMTIADTFDACKNIGAGARILAAGFRPQAGEDAQPALLRALSRYNTGDPARGFRNGYVTRVQANAAQVVPAIRVAGATGQAGGEGTPSDAPPAPPPPPPSWDVFGQARYARQYGGMVFGGTATQQPAPQPVAPPPQAQPAAPAPVTLQTVQAEAAPHAATANE